ncbi:MAG: mechanosensitive ion channel domain-containing protein [Cycloclasticus sp.]
MNFVRFFVCWCFFVLCASTSAVANDAIDIKAIELQLKQLQTRIELIAPELAESAIDEARLLKFRQTLRLSRSELQNIVAIIKPVNDSTQVDLADLGVVPEGEKPSSEPENIQRLRAELTTDALLTEGVLKQAEALSSKTSRLLEKASSLRRSLFLNGLFERQISPFNIALLKGAVDTYIPQLSGYKRTFKHIDKGVLFPLITASLLFFIVFFVATLLSRKRLHKKLQAVEERPDIFSTVSQSLLLPLVALGLGLFIIYQTLVTQQVINESNGFFIDKSLLLIGFLIVVYLMTKRFSKAKIIRANSHLLIFMVALIYSADALLLASGKITGMPLEFAVVQSYIVTTTFACILGLCSFFILLAPQDARHYFFPRQAFIVFIAISLCIIVANTFGYAALSRYIFEGFVLVFSLFAAFLVIRAIIRPYLYKLDRHFVREKTDQDSEHFIYFWFSLSVDLILLFISLPLIARILGTEWLYIQDTLKQAFFGFKIGTMTVSIANIGIAFIVFLILLFVTRLIQRLLEKKILPKTKMDASIRQSITQVLGYVGLIIALMAGISTMGFDLTNLALIAGALSVGIGFGLQSIVSNFVSGLILLFERPIKVGDWVITNSGEGIVKKISVRATVVETFDRTSIIVPNSEFISSSVKNWTHADKIGRVIINVGVSYSSNPQQVQDILLELISSNNEILNNPKPTIYFKDFADSALIFEIRFFIRNIREVFDISSKVRFQIWDAFKEAGIEISFPQRDLHIRTAPGLEGILNGK